MASDQPAERYRLLAPLGSGGMGVVYQAFDRLTGQTVAFKQVIAQPSALLFNSHADPTHSNLALAQEFQALASLHHPHIIAVQDYSFDSYGRPFFTMELLLKAKTILEAAPHRDEIACVTLLSQTLQALAYLHRRGIIHRDLKPSNILVVEGQVKVLDFGLSVSIGQNKDAAGTLAYIPPENLAETPGGAPAAPTADLYTLGVIAYELLAGQLPFGVNALSDLIDDILTGVPNLRLLKCRPAVAAVIGRLLAKHPDERFPNAVAVMKALSEALGQPLPAETEATRESFLQAARFVGREAELTQLTAASRSAQTGHGSLWLLGGESGVGKSRLLQEVRTRALIQGIRVLRGQAVPESGLPYQLWREAARWLALLAQPDDLESSLLKTLVPDLLALLERPIADAPALEPLADQTRLINTFLHLLQRAAAQRPLLLLFEDLQWADANSLALLTALQQALSQSAFAILVIATYRDDERPDLPAQLPAANVLNLKRLGQANIAQLTESMLGAEGRQPDIVRWLYNETEGNAFFVVETVRALAEDAGQLENVAFMTLPTHVQAGGIQRVVTRRLERAPLPAQPLLRLAALAGRALDPLVLQTADPAVNIEDWLNTCADAAILEIQSGHWQFAHDKFREGLLQQIDSDQRPALHQSLAQVIEAVYPDSPSQAAALAHHWGQAAQPQRERPYAALAGKFAADHYANAEALRFLGRALALTTDRAAQIPILLQLGSVQELLGQRAEAETLFQQALSAATDSGLAQSQAQAQVALSQVAYRRSQFAEASALLEQAQATAESLNDQPLLATIYNRLGRIYSDRGEHERALSDYEKTVQIAQTFGDDQLLCNCLGNMGVVYFDLGQWEKSLDYQRQRLQLARRIGDRRSVAIAIGNIGNVHYMRNEYPQCLECYQEKLPLVLELQDQHEVNLTFGNLAAVYTDLGAVTFAHPCVAYQLNNTLRSGDRWGTYLGLGNLALGYGVDGQHNHVAQIWPRVVQLCRKLDMPYHLCHALYGYANWLAERGQLAQAHVYNTEAEQIATQVERKDILFAAQILRLRLQGLLAQIDPASAVLTFEAWLTTRPEPADQASLH
jgi:tetratricopeptide (TPR) repeat protein